MEQKKYMYSVHTTTHLRHVTVSRHIVSQTARLLMYLRVCTSTVSTGPVTQLEQCR